MKTAPKRLKNAAKLPREIYVVSRRDSGSEWFEADPDYEGFENGDSVGVYVLQEVRLKRVIHKLEIR